MQRSPITILPARADWIPLPVLIWASDRQIAPDLARLAPATNPQALWAQSSFAGLAAKAAVALGTKLADTANDFTLPAWQKWQVLAFGRAFAPDLIIGLGPQANAFIAAIAPGNPKIHPKVRSHVFFNDVSVVGRPATAGPGPMTVTVLRALLKNKRRILVLWTDPAPAAGDDVLGGLLPLIATRNHAVVVTGISDGRYSPTIRYEGKGRAMLALGNQWSWRPDLPKLVDFLERNRLTAFSADHSMHCVFESDPISAERAKKALGSCHSIQAHWRWFTLNEHFGPYCFPAHP